MVTTTSHCFCSDCGTANLSQARFCVACGALLSQSTSASMLAPGAILKERYRIVEHIGSGGHGEVYRAEDTQFAERVVAIKSMSQSGLSQQEAVEASEAFKREAFLLAKLVHPNLPAIHDYFSERNSWYLVMSFIEGETLEHYMESVGGALPVDEALQIGIQLCSVLEYLHEHRPPIIFRDLKPSNIMRTSRGQLYLIDFGIARIFKQGQSRDTIALGSPGYAAPEQYGKQQSTPRTDIYNLGATLHHLLSGRDPSESPFVFPPLALTGYPGLNELIAHMLNNDAKYRPASVGEVRQELQRISGGRTHGLSAREMPRRDPSPIFVVSDEQSGHEAEYEHGEMGQMAEQRQQQQTYYQPPEPPKREVSRRKLLIAGAGGMAGLGLFALSGLFLKRRIHSIPAGHQAPSAPPMLKDLNSQQIPDTALLAVAWSADGERYATGGVASNTLVVYAAADSKQLVSYTHHTDSVSSLCWSPDSRSIASASYDTTVQLWNSATGEHILSYTDHAAPVLTVSWSQDGNYVASADAQHTIRLWSAQTGATLKVLTQQRDQVTAVAWSPDGMLLASASADKTVDVWDVQSGNADLTYTGHTKAVQAVAWSPDNKRVASAGDDATVQVWNELSGAEAVVYQGHRAPVWGVAWSPDGKYLASASWDSTVRIWSIDKNASVYTFRGHSSSVLAVAWSSKGQIASVDVTGVVKIWRPEGI